MTTSRPGWPSTPVPLPFHAHIELVAQPGGAVVPRAHPKSHTPWGVPYGARARGCDPGLPRGLQRRPEAICLDRRRGGHPAEGPSGQGGSPANHHLKVKRYTSYWRRFDDAPAARRSAGRQGGTLALAQQGQGDQASPDGLAQRTGWALGRKEQPEQTRAPRSARAVVNCQWGRIGLVRCDRGPGGPGHDIVAPDLGDADAECCARDPGGRSDEGCQHALIRPLGVNSRLSDDRRLKP